MYAVAYAESFQGEGQSFVTNQLGECRRHDHYRMVRGHAPKKFAKLHLKIRIFKPVKSEASRKPKKAFVHWWIFKFKGPRQGFPKIDVLWKKTGF